jgi:molybdate transport repressor ModE-like protein
MRGKEMQTGAVIVAAGMSSRIHSFKPMLKIGSITMIQRIIQTFEQAGVYPIVLITGNNADILEKHVAKKNVICLRNENYQHTEMFDSAKIGLSYLADKCDRILFTPTDIPLFTKDTIVKLLNTEAKLASPVFEGRKGHPLLIHTSLLSHILEYNGNQGLKGAICETGYERELVEVEDRGILFDADKEEDYEELLEYHNKQIFHPQIQIKLVKEKDFMGEREAMLLKLIHYTNSVKYACQQLNISYSKGWTMINLMEEQAGFSVVDRQPGGINGGYTALTEEGRQLLDKYSRFEKEVKLAVQKIFEENFFK